MIKTSLRSAAILVLTLCVLTGLQGCGKKQSELSPETKRYIDQLLADANFGKRAAEAEKAARKGDERSKEEIAEEAKREIQKLPEPPTPAPDTSTPSCDQIQREAKQFAQSTAAMPKTITTKLVAECQEQIAKAPVPRDDQDRERRKQLALLLRILSLVALAYGETELAAGLWAAAGAIDAQQSPSPVPAPTPPIPAPTQAPVYKGNPDPETQETLKRRGARNFLEGESVGNFLVEFPEGATAIKFVEGKTNKDILVLNIDEVKEWKADRTWLPKKSLAATVRRRADGTIEMESYSYESANGARFTATWSEGRNYPTVTKN